MNKLVWNYEQAVGNSWTICSMVTAIFYYVIILMSDDVSNTNFFIIFMIFIKGLTNDTCNRPEYINTNIT